MSKLFAVVRRVSIDAISIILVYLPWLVLNVINQPFVRGFYCDDASLQYPYKPSTVPSSWMLGFGLTIVIGTILVVEFVHDNCQKRRNRAPAAYIINQYHIPAVLVTCYRQVGCFIFGAAVQQTMTAIGKFSVGRLRPHFFAGCQPEFSQPCEGLNGLSNYITDYECLGSDSKVINDMRLSFPSGHASFSTFVGVYLALYIRARLTWDCSWLLRHVIGAMSLYTSLYVCLTRISDYKHHWSDVLAGSFLGGIAAVLTACFITRLWDWAKEEDDYVPTATSQEVTSLPNVHQAHDQRHISSGV